MKNEVSLRPRKLKGVVCWGFWVIFLFWDSLGYMRRGFHWQVLREGNERSRQIFPVEQYDLFDANFL